MSDDQDEARDAAHEALERLAVEVATHTPLTLHQARNLCALAQGRGWGAPQVVALVTGVFAERAWLRQPAQARVDECWRRVKIGQLPSPDAEATREEAP